jgi:hypothetical protein
MAEGVSVTGSGRPVAGGSAAAGVGGTDGTRYELVHPARLNPTTAKTAVNTAGVVRASIRNLLVIGDHAWKRRARL